MNFDPTEPLGKSLVTLLCHPRGRLSGPTTIYTSTFYAQGAILQTAKNFCLRDAKWAKDTRSAPPPPRTISVLHHPYRATGTCFCGLQGLMTRLPERTAGRKLRNPVLILTNCCVPRPLRTTSVKEQGGVRTSAFPQPR